MATNYALNSTKTAIALLLPSGHSADINAIRQSFDKAFHKWPPHINILYPSITPAQLESALPIFREAIRTGFDGPLSVKVDCIGTFKHRHNATVFLQPDEGSTAALTQLRTKLVQAIGLSEKAGTLDGAFKPHLTLGQASLSGNALDTLVEKCSTLAGLEWQVDRLAVMTRKPTGEMEVVDHISLLPAAQALTHGPARDATDEVALVWTPCFVLDSCNEWKPYSTNFADGESERPISILSYNILADTFGCSFEERLPLIIDAINCASSHNVAEVLCLQEVSSTMVTKLLGHPFIQQCYPYCSHTTKSLLVNHLNLITLSSRPFRFFSHHFEERHKSALVVRPDGLPFEIANIHLTAALKDHTVAAKHRQITSLTQLLAASTRGTDRHSIIAGDFNSATSDRTIRDALRKGDINSKTLILARNLVDPDVWSDAYLLSRNDSDTLEDEDGATFDVQKNPLASESNAPADQRPQRYDRILFRREDCLHVQSFNLFGLPNESGKCGSDHFGICATLQPFRLNASQVTTIEAAPITVQMVDAQEGTVNSLLEPFMPTSKDYQQRVAALARLTTLLQSDARLKDLSIVPLGSYALDTYFADSDVDVLAIGSLSPAAFFNISASRLRALHDGIHELHYINSLVPVLEIEVLGIKFDVQYCQAPELLQTQKSLRTDLMAEVFENDSLLIGLQPHVLRPLNTFRDAAYILRTVPCLESFRLAHRFLSLYLRRRGLYSAKFGFLGGVHLTLMLNHVIKRLQPSEVAFVSAESLAKTFIEYFARFSWSSDVVCEPLFPHKDYRRTPREPIVILAIHSPTARPNVASSCTRCSAEAIVKEFHLAATHIEEGDWQWMLRDVEATYEDFIEDFGAFLLISVDMWDLERFSDSAQRAFIGHVESRMSALMVKLSRIDSLYARSWPFKLLSDGDEIEHGKQVKIFYAVGATGSREQDTASRKIMQNKVVEVARSHETMMRTCEYFDDKHIWVQVDVRSRKQLIDLHLTNAA